MKGIVAAGHEITAQACAQMLRDGGNAFDAALAGMVTSAIPEMVLSSLGGGGFLMAYDAARDKTTLYDFFAQTPKHKRATDELDFYAIHADFGPAVQEFHVGAGSTATPGMIPGLFAIHKDLCRLPLADLLEPAICAARDGIKISAFHAYLFEVIAPILTKDPGPRVLFAPRGDTLKAGELFRNPDFAGTLDALAREGEPYYRVGELGRAILAQSEELGGHLTPQDLTEYKVERRTPLTQTYRQHQFYLNPAPSAGGPLIGFSLGMLQRLCPSDPPDLVKLLDVMALTNKARRAKTCKLSEFAGDAHIARHLAKAASHPSSQRGTTHISVLDEKGNAAALTISNGEGNGLMLKNTGIMLNNMLGEEDLHDEGFHQWPTDQRLSSMMAPTLIKAPDGTSTALGSGGSNRIRSAVLQVASGLVDHGLSVAEAVGTPRAHVEKSNKISFEDSPERAPLTKQGKKQLRSLHPDAHGWPQPNMFFGGVHTVQKKPSGGFEGVGDPRRDGFVIEVK